jgi:CheY-like chemotaxis protein
VVPVLELSRHALICVHCESPVLVTTRLAHCELGRLEVHLGEWHPESIAGKVGFYAPSPGLILEHFRAERAEADTAKPDRRNERTRMDSPKAPILVVDDDEDTRSSLELLLRGNGYATTSVEDAATALDYLHARSACLIVLDLNMPGRDGRDLLRELKAHPALAGIAVIVFTGDPGKAPDSAAAFVRKGDDPDALLIAVKAHCRQMCRC